MCTIELRETRLAQKIYGTKVTKVYVGIGLFAFNMNMKTKLWLGKRYNTLRIGLGCSYVNVDMWNLEFTQNAHSRTQSSNAVMLRSYVH